MTRLDPQDATQIRRLAEYVAAARFHAVDAETGRPRRFASAWPGALADAVLRWLDAGLPAERPTNFAHAMRRARNTRWVTPDGHVSTAPAILAERLAEALATLGQSAEPMALDIEGSLWSRRQMEMHP